MTVKSERVEWALTMLTHLSQDEQAEFLRRAVAEAKLPPGERFELNLERSGVLAGVRAFEPGDQAEFARRLRVMADQFEQLPLNADGGLKVEVHLFSAPPSSTS